MYEFMVEKFMLTAEQLESNGFPLQDPDDPEMIAFRRSEQDARRKPITDDYGEWLRINICYFRSLS